METKFVISKELLDPPESEDPLPEFPVKIHREETSSFLIHPNCKDPPEFPEEPEPEELPELPPLLGIPLSPHCYTCPSDGTESIFLLEFPFITQEFLYFHIHHSGCFILVVLDSLSSLERSYHVPVGAFSPLLP